VIHYAATETRGQYQELPVTDPEAPLRADILNEAVRLTCGDRHQDYGDPRENFTAIAEIFKAMTGHALTPREVALFHVATKIGRLRHSPQHRDSHVDAAAYIALAFEVTAPD
jgi:hypothetical protein